MKNPILPTIMLLLLAAALYLLPDGSFYGWRLHVRGLFARLEKSPDPRGDFVDSGFSDRRDLLDVLTQKEAEIADLRRRLRELGVTRDSIDNVSVTPARVMNLGPDNSLDTFTLDVGTVDGVRSGQAVVVGQALAGVIVRCEDHASLAFSLSSTGCYISARIGDPVSSQGRPRLLGAVRGSGNGEVTSVVFSTDNPAGEGWFAMTSGLEKSIPEGLLIGRLAGGFSEGEENGTMEAALRPTVDLSSLDFVAVIGRE